MNKIEQVSERLRETQIQISLLESELRGSSYELGIMITLESMRAMEEQLTAELNGLKKEKQ